MNSSCLCKENIQLTSEIKQRYPKEIEKSITNTVKYDDVRTLETKGVPLQDSANISVIYEDTVDAGFYLKKEGYNPLILNMASNTTPGGGWRKGATAQEESLFYRSLYYLALEDRGFYPLSIYSAIYTPDVFFFRSKQLDGYGILPYEECEFLSCVAIPALRKPKLTNGKYGKQPRKVMKEKIRGIFKIALEHKHDSLVLGAFGNGAFQNPPHDVAEIFNEVISEYKNYFRKIQKADRRNVYLIYICATLSF